MEKPHPSKGKSVLLLGGSYRKMRKVVLQKEDFAMFHQDITPTDYEFYRTHSGAFKRMWQEQVSACLMVAMLFSFTLTECCSRQGGSGQCLLKRSITSCGIMAL